MNKETLTEKVQTEYCYHNCEYFELDGGPNPVMICTHPEAPDNGFIISHPEYDEGLPKKCPLINK